MIVWEMALVLGVGLAYSSSCLHTILLDPLWILEINKSLITP